MKHTIDSRLYFLLITGLVGSYWRPEYTFPDFHGTMKFGQSYHDFYPMPAQREYVTRVLVNEHGYPDFDAPLFPEDYDFGVDLFAKDPNFDDNFLTSEEWWRGDLPSTSAPSDYWSMQPTLTQTYPQAIQHHDSLDEIEPTFYDLDLHVPNLNQDFHESTTQECAVADAPQSEENLLVWTDQQPANEFYPLQPQPIDNWSPSCLLDLDEQKPFDSHGATNCGASSGDDSQTSSTSEAGTSGTQSWQDGAGSSRGSKSDDAELVRANVALSSEQVIESSFEEFTQLLSQYQESSQLELIKKIRKRGRNRKAAAKLRGKMSSEAENLEKEVGSLSQRKVEAMERIDRLKALLEGQSRRHHNLMTRLDQKRSPPT